MFRQFFSFSIKIVSNFFLFKKWIVNQCPKDTRLHDHLIITVIKKKVTKLEIGFYLILLPLGICNNRLVLTFLSEQLNIKHPKLHICDNLYNWTIYHLYFKNN